MSRLLTLAMLLALGCHSNLQNGASDGGGVGGTASTDGGDPITRGANFVLARGCPTCHQSTNAADGILSGQTTPRPGTLAYAANLTPDNDTGIGSWSDADITRAMRSGVDDENAPLCPPMPHFDGSGGDGRPMGDDEANAIIAYLRSLPPVNRVIPESVCPPLKYAASDMSVPLPPPDLSQVETTD